MGNDNEKITKSDTYLDPTPDWNLLMTIFYLIRHAHADWTTDEQRPLSSKGQKDAQRLTDLFCDIPISRIYSSPFQRARQTVAPLACRLKLPIHIEPDLRERKLGDEPSASDFFEAVKQTWLDPYFTYPDGEANTAARDRGIAVVQRLLEEYPEAHLVLSTHGTLLALVLQHHDPQIDYVFWKALTMPDVYTLSVSPGKPAISRLWQE